MKSVCQFTGQLKMLVFIRFSNCSTGFLQKEIEKAEIPIVDTGENPDAPHPREMIDLEVGTYFLCQSSFIQLY